MDPGAEKTPAEGSGFVALLVDSRLLSVLRGLSLPVTVSSSALPRGTPVLLVQPHELILP